MAARRVGLSILTACLLLAAACNQPGRVVKTDRLVTIQVGGTRGCEVDYPVAVAYESKHHPRWKSDDKAYRIHFVDKKTPFSVDSIDVPAGQKSSVVDLLDKPADYYKYEILSDPDTSQQKVCKDADDDHDTGLNVKR